MEYTVDFFERKFSAIPEHLWQEGGWGSYDIHCAGGHCGVRGSMGTITQYPDEFIELEKLFKTIKVTQRNYYNGGLYSDYITIIINDGMAVEYPQEHPKERILAALRDIKKMQESSQMLSSEPNDKPSVATEAASSNWLDKTKNFTSLIPIPDEVSDLKLIEN